jgi:hypothetical protein
MKRSFTVQRGNSALKFCFSTLPLLFFQTAAVGCETLSLNEIVVSPLLPLWSQLSLLQPAAAQTE